MKAVFDFFVSLLLLVVLLPILIIVSILIVFDDPGSPIFKQKRVGYRGNVFNIYKFRSMKINSDSAGPYYTMENDTRITNFGKFIRRTSLDELPQLFNVILGDMSLVGPRPDVPAQESNYTSEQWEKRITVKPGITGLAQSTLRSAATPEQRINLDLDYVDNRSFIFDLKILFMTFKQVIKKGGY